MTSALSPPFETANVIPLCPVDVSSLVAWIQSIPFEAWPQQRRLADGQIRPAMVQSKELAWADEFFDMTDSLVDELLERIAPKLAAYNYMLSVVMPGHSIPPHRDRQIEEWLARVHVPLTSNDRALFIAEGVPHVLEVGTAYLVNVQAEHEIRNEGETPRIHFMFDVMRFGAKDSNLALRFQRPPSCR